MTVGVCFPPPDGLLFGAGVGAGAGAGAAGCDAAGGGGAAAVVRGGDGEGLGAFEADDGDGVVAAGAGVVDAGAGAVDTVFVVAALCGLGGAGLGVVTDAGLAVDVVCDEPPPQPAMARASAKDPSSRTRRPMGQRVQRTLRFPITMVSAQARRA